jgi:hypothetical protein
MLATTFVRYIYPRYAGLRRELDTHLNRYDHGAYTTAASPAGVYPPLYRATRCRPG